MVNEPVDLFGEVDVGRCCANECGYTGRVDEVIYPCIGGHELGICISGERHSQRHGLTTSGCVLFSSPRNNSSLTSASKLSSFLAFGRRKVATICSVSVLNGWARSGMGVAGRGDHCAQDDADDGESAHSAVLVDGEDGVLLYRSGVGGRGAARGDGESDCWSVGSAKKRFR